MGRVMSRFEVEVATIEITATTLRSSAEEMRAAAHRIGGAMQVAGSAGGSAALASAAATAAGQWVSRLERYADAGLALSRATAQAALAYELIELQASGRLTPVVRP